MQTLKEFMDDPAVRHLEMIREYDHPELGRLRLMGMPLVFSESPTRDGGRPPLLGEHTEAILSDLGYSAAAVDDLRRRRVIGGPPA